MDNVWQNKGAYRMQAQSVPESRWTMDTLDTLPASIFTGLYTESGQEIHRVLESEVGFKF